MNKKELIETSKKVLENLKDKKMIIKSSYEKINNELNNDNLGRIDKYKNIFKKLNIMKFEKINNLSTLNKYIKEKKLNFIKNINKIKSRLDLTPDLTYKKKEEINLIINRLNDKTINSLLEKDINIDVSIIKYILGKLDYLNKNFFFKKNNISVPINDKSIDIFNTLVADHHIYRAKGSDQKLVAIIAGSDSIHIYSSNKIIPSYKHQRGSFFNHFIKDEYNILDLYKYQVFSQKNINDNLIKKEDNIYILRECFINTIINFNHFSEEQINNIKIKYFSNFKDISLTDIKKLCIEYKINIKMSYPKKDNNNKDRIIEYIGDENNHILFRVGLVNNHFFINEKTIYTKYFIMNMDKLKDVNNNINIFKSYQKNNKTYYYYDTVDENKISSYELIKYLYNNKDKFLTLINYENSKKLKLTNNLKDFVNVEYNNLNYDNKKNTKKFNNKEFNDKIKIIIYADTEACFNQDNNHIPYIINFKIDDIHINACGYNCIKEGFNLLNQYLYEKYDNIDDYNIIIYFHNMNYDIRFIYNVLYNRNMILKDNKIISHIGTSFYNKVNYSYNFKDSYLLISSPLKKFNEMFKLGNVIKEIMPYTLYTTQNIDKIYLNINYVLENFIKDDEKEHFLNNIKRWDCYNLHNNEEYNIIKYSLEYCKIDCDVLQGGMDTFNSWFKKSESDNINFINIHNFLTLPSLAYEILINWGCFDNVKLLSGVPSNFISKCIIGGRTMTMNNNKIKCSMENDKYVEEHIINEKINQIVGIEKYKKSNIIKNNIKNKCYTKTYNNQKKILDLDCISLYPSSMYDLKGFLKGSPKILQDNNLNMNFLNSVDGYFIEILIKKVNIKLNFPLQCVSDDKKTKQFINDLENKKIIIDKIGLEELIKYQNIEFDIIRGYYFNEGYNNKIKECIEFLFNMRVKLKKDKNPAEVIYKLIMNSSYGKTILKPINKDTILLNSKKKLDNYISNNFEFIDKIIKISDNGKYIVSINKHINDHFNCPQVGVSILSNSKKIMNKVFNIASKNNINIFYQDTDSLHIYEDDLNNLIKKYEQNGDILVGKNMLNFHSDFQLKGAEKNIHSLKSIFLGKKCYINYLYGENDDDKKIYGYHMRMKGVSNEAILDLCKKMNNINNKNYKIRMDLGLKYEEFYYFLDENYKINPFDLYHILYNNEELEFDLLASGNKVRFEMKLGNSTSNKLEFSRKIKFVNCFMVDDENDY